MPPTIDGRLAPRNFTYPVIMIGKDGCIKLFVSPTDGITLRNSHSARDKLCDCIGVLTVAGTSYDHNGITSGGSPLPAHDSAYWRLFEGELTLAND